MDRKELAKQAFDECCNENTTVKYGVKRGFPFWNIESTQFMYVPAFHFTAIRGCQRYLYKAVDEEGNEYSFEADDCAVLLTPIWNRLPEGVIKLTVEAFDNRGNSYGICGARTFFKLASFPEKTPEKKCSYKECAVKAFEYAMQSGFIRSYLNDGKPDPYYDLNTYPSKMIAALGEGMISYARLCPEKAETALKVATNAADYLIGITPRGNDPLADLPPTYVLDFCPDPVKYGINTGNFAAAQYHFGTMIMIYPASAGKMYVMLSDITGDTKYLREALNIAEYYEKTQLENGSWYLVRSSKTGEVVNDNFISPMEQVVPFLMKLYESTKDSRWFEVAKKAVKYVEDTQLSSYNWEGQFEDSPLSTNYMSLSHYGPCALAKYYAEYFSDDEEKMKIAVDIMRFCEDQFVVWNRPNPWYHQSPPDNPPYDTSIWHTPAALEQYQWYVPIDASTSSVLSGFLALYKAGQGELWLAKARVLADQLTIVQHENGQIPTHWMNTPDAEENFWFNCMFESCWTLEKMTEFEE